MIRKWKLLLVGVSCVMGTAMAQNNPILLFPKGAPGETTKLIEKADADGGKTGGETVLRITNVSEPTITVYPAPDEVATGAAVVVCPGGDGNLLTLLPLLFLSGFLGGENVICPFQRHV